MPATGAGARVWRYQTPKSDANPAIYSAPVCTEDACRLLGSFDGYLYCLNIEDGKLKWRIGPVPGAEITSAPLTDGRRIAVAIRQNQRGQVWKTALQSSVKHPR